MHRSWLVLTSMLLAACSTPSKQNFPSPYTASGNEPFWSVTVTDGKAAVERPDQPRTERTVAQVERMQDGWSLHGESFGLQVANRRCENDMSGAPFENTVSMVLDGREYRGCGGRELPPDRLEGTQWTVSEIHDRSLTTEKRPFIAIDEQGKVSGTDGCNRTVGGFSFERSGDIRHVSEGWIATRMACADPQMRLATDYAQALVTTTEWRFEGVELKLLDKTGATVIRARRSY